MRFWKDESGQALVMTVVCLTSLLGFMALAVDVGILFRTRRNVQIAADAAATAGALDYRYNASTSSATTAGKSASSQNGFTDGANATVNINFLPGTTYGVSATATFVEAQVGTPSPTFFLGLFHMNSVTVAARAVAGPGTKGCVWALGTSGTDISNTGSGDLNVPNCIIYDDSSSASSAMTNTGSGDITARAIGVVGGYTNTGSGTISPKPNTGMVPVSDPLSSLQAPSIPAGACSPSGSAACNPSNTGSGSSTVLPGTYTSISNTGSGTMTLSSGTYIITGNLSNTGSGTMTLGNGNYTIGGNFTSTGSASLNIGSGLYIVEGNLGLTGSGPMTGTGVSFYTEGSTSVTGSGNVAISAPTSGAENGILFFQSRSDGSPMTITGANNLNLQGIVYVPNAQLTFTGSGSGSMNADLVVKSLNLTGSGTLGDYFAVNPTSPLASVVLVE